MSGTRLRRVVVIGTALSCVLGATAAHARTKWVVHDGGTITGVATAPTGGDFDVCDDALRALAGWSEALSPGDDPDDHEVHPSVLTTVGYEVFSAPPGVDLFVDDSGTEPVVGYLDGTGTFQPADLAATVTTPTREVIDPIEIGTDWYVFAAAPLSAELTGVQAGETVGVKPHPGSAFSTVSEFDAVDCGDAGFLRWWERDHDFGLAAGSRVLAGDVTGDRRSDLVCQVPTTGAITRLVAGPGETYGATTVAGSLGMCHAAASRLLLADANGNGRADLVCHNAKKGNLAVALARKGGTFVKTDWKGNPRLCLGATNQLLAGDVNGDGRADLVCHKPASGTQQVALAKRGGKYSTISWKGKRTFCRNADVVVGDVDGDGRADLLCHRDSGAHAIAYAKPSGTFGKAGWKGRLPGCAAPWEVSLAHLDAGARADLLCHGPDGDVRVALARKGGKLKKLDFARRADACHETGDRMLLGDASQDARADLLCVQGGTGYVSVLFSDL